MERKIQINNFLCKKCALCIEVCPNKLIIKNETNEITSKSSWFDLCFKCGQCMAICPSKAIEVNCLSYEKDFFDIPQAEPNLYENTFFELIHTRRAIRNFKDKKVPIELLTKIAEAISFAPPSFPPIKIKIIVVQNSEIIKRSLPYMIDFYEKLVKKMKNPIYRYLINKEIGHSKFETLQKHLIPLLISRLPALKDGTEDTIIRNAPAMILFIADKNEEDFSKDISIAATYGILAAHALGLGASIMDILHPAINKIKELRSLYKIKENQIVLNSIIIGYPKFRYQRGIKRNLKCISWI